jgi:hypothetical protein
MFSTDRSCSALLNVPFHALGQTLEPTSPRPVFPFGFFTAAHLLTARLRQRVVAQLTNHLEGTLVEHITSV